MSVGETGEGVNVSVIVPFHNSVRTIRECLESLLSQSWDDYEIIAVNNNSTDGSDRVVEGVMEKAVQPGRLKLIHETKTGPASARNAGVRHASGRCLAFIDSDCVADRDWLKQAMGHLSDPGICGIGGRVHAVRPSSIYEKFSAAFTTKSPAMGIYERFDFQRGGGFPSLNLILRKEAFLQVEGFREDFQPSCEDYDLCIRLYGRGGKLKAVEDTEVLHKHRATLGTMAAQAFRYGLNHPKLLRHHFPGTFVLQAPLLSSRTFTDLPLCGWVDLQGADKKFLFLAILSTAVPFLVFLLPLYYVQLGCFIARRLREAGIVASKRQKSLMPALMFVKSLSLTLGRFTGGLKHGAICL